MAYSTGSGNTMADLLSAIRTFAVAQGWSSAAWNSSTPYLALSSGICFVTFQGFTTTTYTDYTTGSPVNTPDYTIRTALANSINTGLTVYHGHPGSLVTSASDGDAVVMNDLNGPYVAWHLFGDSTHIHCVVQTSAERYQHLSFGTIDKRGMTHNGVAYLVGRYSKWLPDYYPINNSNSSFNNPSGQYIPFCNGFEFYFVSSNGHPVVWGADNLHMTTSTANFFLITIQGCRSPVLFPRTNTISRLLSGIVSWEALPFSNITPMIPIPVIFANTSTNPDQTLYLGDFPNVRLVNINGLVPAQEVSVSGETWKVFPSLRQAPWGSDWTTGYDRPTSGQYGLAYKKVT